MKKALIFHGGWDGHTPKEVSEVFRDILQEENFKVTVSDTLDVLDDEQTIRKYDLFVPVWTMGTISASQCSHICEAVAAGAGIAGCHGGMCDAFRDSTEWQFMTGAQWVSHPGGDGVTYQVNLLPGSQLTEGLSDFSLTSEQYYIHVDPCVKIHATTTFPISEGHHASNGTVEVPVVFTKRWGKGKVFYNSLGHTFEVFRIPEAKELMRRGFLWAAR